jgi:general secretion pathway protein L
VLRRRVELPLAAAENLREVLSFEMDRHTPFQAGEVYFDYRLISKDTVAKRLTADLAVVTRSLADEGVARLTAWGLAPDRLDVVQGSAAQNVGFNLLPVSAMRREGRDLHRATAGAAIVVCGLLAVAFYLPILQKQEILAASEAHLALVQVEAAAAKELSAQVESLLERGRFVVEQKRGRPAVAELLDEVTELLPDHTWIIQFGWTGERLTLSGYSAKPSALIALFEQSDMLSEVRFNSPVTVDQKIGLERFNLSATVARGPEP